MISSTLSPTFVPKASLTDWKSLTSRSSSAYFRRGRRDLRGRLQPRQELGPIEHSMRVVRARVPAFVRLPCRQSFGYLCHRRPPPAIGLPWFGPHLSVGTRLRASR